MADIEIKVQTCGCISLPEDIMTDLGIGPGTDFRLIVDAEHRTLMLRAVSPRMQRNNSLDRAACPVSPVAL